MKGLLSHRNTKWWGLPSVGIDALGIDAQCHPPGSWVGSLLPRLPRGSHFLFSRRGQPGRHGTYKARATSVTVGRAAEESVPERGAWRLVHAFTRASSLAVALRVDADTAGSDAESGVPSRHE